MVDFVCPECGSIDHVEGEVRYPYQCPGCERMIEAPPLSSRRDDPEENPMHAVRVKLLPKEVWSARKPRPTWAFEKKKLTWWQANRSSFVFPALLLPVLAVGVYFWLKYPDVSYEHHRPLVQAAAEPIPTEQKQKPPLDAKPARVPEKDPSHAARQNPPQEPSKPAQAAQEDGDPASEQPAQSAAAAEQIDTGADATTSAPPAPAQPDPSLTPRGVTTARPLYGGVPIVTEPSGQGRQVVAASASDMLLILDRRAHNQWLHVIHVSSGREGWVRISQVRITVSGE